MVKEISINATMDWPNRHELYQNKSRYFTPLRKPAWEFEEALFRTKKVEKLVPPPLADFLKGVGSAVGRGIGSGERG